MELMSLAMAGAAAGGAVGKANAEEKAGISAERKAGTLVVQPEDAEVYSLLGGGEARLMLTGERTGGAWWMGRFREDPGFMTHLHYHANTDEQIYVLEGTLSVYLDDKWHELRAGTLALLPKGKPHAQGNRSDKPVHALGSGAPAGFEQMFREAHALIKWAKPGTPEFAAEWGKIMERCDIVSLGPAPQ